MGENKGDPDDAEVEDYLASFVIHFSRLKRDVVNSLSPYSV